MGLTGLQIFKLLPNTNCKKCGCPTCLAFAMKLAAGKESLDKCPDASPEAHAALGAASAPPIHAVSIGHGDRAVTVGEETVFFRHEKTFVHRPALLRQLDPSSLTDDAIEQTVASWARVRIERAGEAFQVDGVAVVEKPGASTRAAKAAMVATRQGLPVALLAETTEGAVAALEPIRQDRPLLVPPLGVDPAPWRAMASRLGIAMVVSGSDVEAMAVAAVEASRVGIADIVLEPPAGDLPSLHGDLSLIRRGALERVHPGLAHPVFVRVGQSAIEKGILGVTKFASVLAIDDTAGETWLPLWTLRQNIYTDPQKPLQIDPGVYAVGEPGPTSPLLVTTNFSLTYFIVSTELEGTGVAGHLAVVDAEGMSVLTAWSAGKFSGDRVAKALKELGAPDKVKHRHVIIPGYVAMISGELEDALGEGWQVLTGPQEASDLGPFLRDMWTAAGPH